VQFHRQLDALFGVGQAGAYLDSASHLAAPRDERAQGVSAGQQVAEAETAVVVRQRAVLERRGGAMQPYRRACGGKQTAAQFVADGFAARAQDGHQQDQRTAGQFGFVGRAILPWGPPPGDGFQRAMAA
jgi:hypothetical protein